MFVTLESASKGKSSFTLSTKKVVKINAPFLVVFTLVLAITVASIVGLVLSENFTLQVPPAMGVLFLITMSMGAVIMLAQAETPPLSKSTNPSADSVLKARYQVQDKFHEFSLPEPLVL